MMQEVEDSPFKFVCDGFIPVTVQSTHTDHGQWKRSWGNSKDRTLHAQI